MSMWIAIGAVRLGHGPEELLQRAADRRQGYSGLRVPFFPRRSRGLLRLELFQRQEAIGQHHQAGVMMEATPRPALEMIRVQSVSLQRGDLPNSRPAWVI